MKKMSGLEDRFADVIFDHAPDKYGDVRCSCEKPHTSNWVDHLAEVLAAVARERTSGAVDEAFEE